MKPNIIAIAGPLRGIVFELAQDEVFIGRDAENQLALNDKSVSRRHCLIKREKGQYKVSDAGSHNGTFLNGVPVIEQTIKHGDHIQIGNTHFVFLLYEEKGSPQPGDVRFDDGQLVTASTTRFRLEDTLYLMAQDLSVLVKIGASINSITSLGALQRQLLESVFEIVPAERGAIVIVDEDIGQPESVFSLDRLHRRDGPFHISRTVARQVIKEGVAILSDDLIDSSGLSKSESLIASRVRSLLCVPLRSLTEVIGIIYLDTSSGEERFNERHLQMVTAIAGFAAGTLENLRRLEWLAAENRRLREYIHVEHNLVGESQSMKELYQFISKVAASDSTVLLRGESGTGKELVARAIHGNSPRAAKPFVAINCAALTETLLESELFGHERGAFTGATAQKRGKIEIADGGTLFLDEVGEMSSQIQAKLLRVLQEREFERVGGTRPIKVDVRVIAATNRDLEEAIRQGTFRQDFYYRLNVVSRTTPPLRSRPEDIALLASYFAAKYGHKCKRRVTGLSAAARDCLLGYDWPGNVRELENTIERAVVLGSTERILPEDLPENVVEAGRAADHAAPKFHEMVREAKRRFILGALEQAGGSYAGAAKLLGIHPNNLHRLIRGMNLKSELTKSK